MRPIILERKGSLLLTVCCLILGIGIHTFPYLHPLKATYTFVKFESNLENHGIKELQYTVAIKNQLNREVDFHVVIERPKADWYPYLNSIPKKYYSEALTLGPQQGEFYELKTTYQSEDDRITGGSIGDLKVKFISLEEYRKIFSTE